MEQQNKQRLQPGYAVLTFIHRKWRTWRERAKTKKILMAMNDDRLKDIGLKRDDVDRL
ncbi:DUF1127 domain-containing protein [Gibbsiella quercinecans]|uniref:DUF1127 domain-containing protein n=1 Tax=Gibbsiella quercinecans TaxID=929813 RepID=UPI000EF1E53E|nr:DUF1127 domain-containing protein [Gibbsiella quercinecans]